MKKYSLWILFFGCFFSCKEEAADRMVTPITINSGLFGQPDLPSDNPLTVEGVDLGRHLFYDKILSKSYEVSCASCHQQRFAFSDTATFSLGVNGSRTDRQSMSLSNLGWQEHFFWDGRASTLEEQALLPIQNPKEMDLTLEEMVARLKSSELYTTKFECAFPGQEISSDLVAKALSQFERTIISSNSRYDQYKLGLIEATSQEKRGEQLFKTHPEPSVGLRGGNCGDCHSGSLFMSSDFSNNGLDTEFQDLGRGAITENPNDDGTFKIPTLRNIALTAPYMHDGRFTTLEEVLDHYNEHIQQSATLDRQITAASNNFEPLHTSLGLTDQEKEDIIAFLKMLTDEGVINKEELSSPF